MTGGDERTDSAPPRGQPTPEFLLWAIEYRCPLREIEGFEQPERTERQLRAARAVSDARRTGRIVDGLCIAERPADLSIPSHAAIGVDTSLSDEVRRQLPMSFAAADALALYGGEEVVQANCPSCPANAERSVDPRAWCGCYGILPLWEAREMFLTVFDTAVRFLGIKSRMCELFAQGTWCVPWHPMWLASPLQGEQLEVLEQSLAAMLDMISSNAEPYAAPIRALHRGVRTACEHSLPLHGQMFPAGEVVGRWWRHAPHCPRCQATWPAPQRYCNMCGWTGKFGTPPKRRARGTRPYRSLVEMVGETRAAEIIARLSAPSLGGALP
jgi:hypothetical protein